VKQIAYRHGDDDDAWYQVHSDDPLTRIDCAHTVWRLESSGIGAGSLLGTR
jgi:hypothetical protein